MFLRSTMNRSDAQLARLATIRQSRDDSRVSEALSALTRLRNLGRGITLLLLRRRARATVGEISDALEQVYGRFVANAQTVSGVYGAAYADDADGGDCNGY